jgi:isoquinoline 1-oxidoreductase alpha subunit
MLTLNINGDDYQVRADPDELLVWVINEKIGLTSTKFGCGIEMCSACPVLIYGEAARSCITDVSQVIGKKIVTREGFPEDHPLK